MLIFYCRHHSITFDNDNINLSFLCHFFSHFSIFSLNMFEPLLFGLSPSNQISSSIFNIFSPIGIWWQRVRFILQYNRVLSIKVPYFNIIKTNIFAPNTTNLTIIFYSIFWFRLFIFSFLKFVHKLWGYLPNGTLEIIWWLFLLANREKSFLVRIVTDFQDKICISDPIVS